MSRLRSDESLEKIALYWRRKLGVEHQFVPDISMILSLLPRYVKGFDVQVVSEGYLRNYEAYADCALKKIFVKPTMWKLLQEDQPRARMTILHEIGHIVLGHSGNRFRLIDGTVRRIASEQESIEELEARRFAGYFLAPTHLVTRFSHQTEICAAFLLSVEAAKLRIDQVRALNAPSSQRQIPASVIDFLEEKRKRGHKIESLSLLDREKKLDLSITLKSEPSNGSMSPELDPPSRGYLVYPCSECRNLTLYRDGTFFTCATCGQTGFL